VWIECGSGKEGGCKWIATASGDGGRVCAYERAGAGVVKLDVVLV
jgi:hypothetical protein